MKKPVITITGFIFVGDIDLKSNQIIDFLMVMGSI
jgi:hypothetical protein